MSHAARLKPEVPASNWYATAIEGLLGVVQNLSRARDVESVVAIVRTAARSLTGADGATFVLRDGDRCHYVEENAIGPLWKGRRFPMSSCISGWVMLNGQPAVIEDIYADPRIPIDAYRPTFVKSLAMVPIRRNGPIGAIGNYWATRRRPSDEEVAVLQALADTTSVALENANLYGELRQKLKILEEQGTRIHAQRDALEVFTRALAHDLKEPIRTIRSYSEIIAQDGALDGGKRQYFGYIQSAADRMSNLIETVFRYTQLEDPTAIPKELCNMTGALDAAKSNLHVLIRERGATVRCDGLPVVLGNSAHMTQLLQNLIGNAITHCDRPVVVTVEAEAAGGRWRFCVRDNGPGIPREHLETIFKPFKRLTRAEGCTGLGLATCRKIVNSHGGEIWCESEPGNGAAFYFTLPQLLAPAAAVDTQAPRPSPAPPPDETELNGQRLAKVMLVDDLEDHLELTRLLVFERNGLSCNLVEARDGTEALALLREAVKAHDPIDLILLDINMPLMDGFELLERIRADEELRHLTVVMCSGSAYEKDRQRAATLGAAGYMVKPASWDALRTILERVNTLRIDHDGDSGRLMRAH